MKKIWIAVACVLVVTLISVPVILLAENVRYSKVHFSQELFSFLTNSTEDVYEVEITDASVPATTTFRDADLMETLVEAFDGLVFREVKLSGEVTNGVPNSITIKTSWNAEISFSYTRYSITYAGKKYVCNTDGFSDTLDTLFDQSAERNGIEKLA